ncbi:MAG: SDR family oxidoreductase [Planctomycetes bacterium]|nr:SDR family oxidoreductase [Planctomycetota bacterium]
MKVLFIGGTGLISSACTALAVERGHEMCLLNRGRTRNVPIPEGVSVVRADARDKESVRNAIKGREFDVVVDWIAYVPEHVEQDIELFRGKVGQYIFISSASAYQKPPGDYLITESTPLVNPHWQYSRDKAACEERLLAERRENGFPFTIVRPSHTYGPGQIPVAVGRWEKPWTIVDRMRRGKQVIVPGDGTSLWTVTHNTDFAKGFVGLLGHQQAIGQAFHITSDEALTWDQIYQAIGWAAGVEPDIIHIPSDFIIAFCPWEEGTLLGDKAVSSVFDNSKIKRFVPDFVATTRFIDGVRQSVEWFDADPARCVIDEVANSQWDKIIEVYLSALDQAAPL